MRRIVIGVIGFLIGAYIFFLYSITVDATVEQVAEGRIPYSYLSRNLDGRHVRIAGYLISDGAHTAIVSSSENGVLYKSKDNVASPEVVRTYTGRLSEIVPEPREMIVNGKKMAPYALDTDASYFTNRYLFGAAALVAGIIMIIAGRNSMRLRVMLSTTQTPGLTK
jgi:hypothetical protein